MSKTIHLVLKGVFYDEIDRGQKTSEYRDYTEYWRQRILRPWSSQKDVTITFHRGYTSKTICFRIKDIIVDTEFIEIELGERVLKELGKNEK